MAVRSATDWKVIGIDPAPSKETVAFDGDRFHECPPDGVSALIAEHTGDRDRVLVLWDAPLRMDPGEYYKRAVDIDAKKLVSSWSPVLEPKAVGVAAAAQCPHNILSMAVLGLPMGVPRHGLQLLTDATALEAGGRWVAEVHPAVALGWWYARQGAGPSVRMPRYKGNDEAVDQVRGRLVELLQPLRALIGPKAWGFLDGDAGGGSTLKDDDQLDAWVAWLLGRLLLAGRAELWRGSDPAAAQRDGGYYVLPRD